MSGSGWKKANPFNSEGTVGRALLTGGLSLPVEAAIRGSAPDPLPNPEAPEAPVSAEDPSVSAAQDAQRRARGRSSTILTGGSGTGNGSGLLARRTLLGT